MYKRQEAETLLAVGADAALRFGHHVVGAVTVNLAVGEPGAFGATGQQFHLDREVAPGGVVADAAVTVADLAGRARGRGNLGGGATRVIIGETAPPGRCAAIR